MDSQKGVTLLELLIVISIIGLLSVVMLFNVFGQIVHANDAKRKMDVNTLSKFFENYYNDHNTFPDQSVVSLCDRPMESYILNIPCDPVAKTPYGYFRAANGGYRICAKLADATDPAIAAINCDGANGCAVGCGYNFCLTSGVTASAIGTGEEVPCTN